VDQRELNNRSACGPTDRAGPRIVAVCADLRDADPIAASLEQLNKGSLLTYDRQDELRRNPPLGEIGLFVLFDCEWKEPTAETLLWIGRYSPGVATAVVGSVGAGGQELTARMGGAFYFVYPVRGGQWVSLVSAAFELADRTDTPAA